HAEVSSFYKDFRRRNGIAYTSDYVLDETVTLLFRRLPSQTALDALSRIEQAIATGHLRLEWMTPARFEKTKALRNKFLDKPRISFTDFTSMVIMEERGIVEILTEDDHFHQVGSGFRKVP